MRRTPEQPLTPKFEKPGDFIEPIRQILTKARKPLSKTKIIEKLVKEFKYNDDADRALIRALKSNFDQTKDGLIQLRPAPEDVGVKKIEGKSDDVEARADSIVVRGRQQIKKLKERVFKSPDAEALDKADAEREAAASQTAIDQARQRLIKDPSKEEGDARHHFGFRTNLNTEQNRPVAERENEAVRRGLRNNILDSLLYKMPTSVLGVKFLTDLLKSIRGTGDLAEWFKDTRVLGLFGDGLVAQERRAYVRLVNDVLAEKKTAETVPVGEPVVADKAEQLRKKIAEDKRLTPEQRKMYLARIEKIQQEHGSATATNEQAARGQVEEVVKTFIRSKISGWQIAREAANSAIFIGAISTGTIVPLLAWRGAINAPFSALQTIQRGLAYHRQKGETGVIKAGKNVVENFFTNPFRQASAAWRTDQADLRTKALASMQAGSALLTSWSIFAGTYGTALRAFGEMHSVSATQFGSLQEGLQDHFRQTHGSGEQISHNLGEYVDQVTKVYRHPLAALSNIRNLFAGKGAASPESAKAAILEQVLAGQQIKNQELAEVIKKVNFDPNQLRTPEIQRVLTGHGVTLEMLGLSQAGRVPSELAADLVGKATGQPVYHGPVIDQHRANYVEMEPGQQPNHDADGAVLPAGKASGAGMVAGAKAGQAAGSSTVELAAAGHYVAPKADVGALRADSHFSKLVPSDAEIQDSRIVEKGSSISEALWKRMSGHEPVTFINSKGESQVLEANAAYVHPGDEVVQTKDGRILVFKASGIGIIKAHEIPTGPAHIEVPGIKTSTSDLTQHIKLGPEMDFGKSPVAEQFSMISHLADGGYAEVYYNGHLVTFTKVGSDIAVADETSGRLISKPEELLAWLIEHKYLEHEEIFGASPELKKTLIDLSKLGESPKLEHGDVLEAWDNNGDGQAEELHLVTNGVVYQSSISDHSLSKDFIHEFVVGSERASHNLTHLVETVSDKHVTFDRPELAIFYHHGLRGFIGKNISEYSEEDFVRIEHLVTGVGRSNLELLKIDGIYSDGKMILADALIKVKANDESLQSILRSIDSPDQLAVARSLWSTQGHSQEEITRLADGLAVSQKLDKSFSSALRMDVASLVAHKNDKFDANRATIYARAFFGSVGLDVSAQQISFDEGNSIVFEKVHIGGNPENLTIRMGIDYNSFEIIGWSRPEDHGSLIADTKLTQGEIQQSLKAFSEEVYELPTEEMFQEFLIEKNKSPNDPNARIKFNEMLDKRYASGLKVAGGAEDPNARIIFHDGVTPPPPEGGDKTVTPPEGGDKTVT
ncbi:MAG: hypothetical protein NTV81_03800, partial [Candidatus Komeilibacteria bacterium]|nr:hypothetical protein [Candidatus Komeilibacteria bacterium]